MAVEADETVGVDRFVIPVVGECDDSWLNDARSVHVDADDVKTAVATAAEDFEQGAVGSGTGMSCLGFKGGIGSSSRVVPERDATVGVLAMTNYQGRLRIDGVPAWQLLETGETPPQPAGSCIVVVATDAALSPHQLERIARRTGLGLARTGSVAYHGSGEIFVAFATGDERSVRDDEVDPLFEATVDATEEAVAQLALVRGGRDRTRRQHRSRAPARRDARAARSGGPAARAGSARRTSAGRARRRAGRAARAAG